MIRSEGQHEVALGADNGVGNVDAFEQGHRSADVSACEARLRLLEDHWRRRLKC